MQNVKVINAMRIMKPKCKEKLNLDDLHRELGGKLYPGRPHMLVLAMRNGRNIQIFRGGCIQILGGISNQEAESMRAELIERSSQRNEACRMLHNIAKTNQLTIVNIVLHIDLQRDLCLKRIRQSDNSLFYEIEIFPAALIRKWEPAHVALFHNGNIIITGVKSVKKCKSVLTSLEKYLRSIHGPLPYAARFLFFM